MQTYTVNVKTENGGYIRVQITARTNYEADQQAKAMYGSRVMSSAVPA